MRPDPLLEALDAAARSLRLAMEAQAGEALAALVDRLAPLLAADGALAKSLDPLLARLVAAQERRDPIGIADVLEHELRPLLELHERT